MDRTSIRTTTYRTHYDGFMVDIVSDYKLYHAWLYHERYGVKSYIFGAFKKDHTKEDFLDMVEAALDNQGYVLNYQDEYMDEEER